MKWYGADKVCNQSIGLNEMVWFIPMMVPQAEKKSRRSANRYTTEDPQTDYLQLKDTG